MRDRKGWSGSEIKKHRWSVVLMLMLRFELILLRGIEESEKQQTKDWITQYKEPEAEEVKAFRIRTLRLAHGQVGRQVDIWRWRSYFTTYIEEC